jgi:hypothetical protein
MPVPSRQAVDAVPKVRIVLGPRYMMVWVAGVALTGSVAITLMGYNEPTGRTSSGSKTEQAIDETDFVCGSGLR